MNQTVPLVVVVGFLGSGKTTLIRDLLPLLETQGMDPFVIINDYANARVDASSLQSEGRTVAPINGNCICCDSIFELMNLLMDMPLTKGRVVLIEANGTTDSTTLLEHLLVNPQLRQRFSPLIQVALVDLERWQKRHWHNELERLQVGTASHILFTREETTPTERFEAVRNHIESFNNKAQQIKLQTFATEILSLADTAGSESVASPEVSDHDHDHDRDQHQLAHAFVGLEIPLPDPMPSSHLQAWLKTLPKEVLRVKGVVRLPGDPDYWFQFQGVGDDRSEATLHTLPMNPVVPPCAVLIGVQLDEQAIKQSLVETGISNR